MDSWTKVQICALQVGGNSAMRDFFQKYGVPQTLSIAQKYDTPQAAAYRRKIKALSKEQPAPNERVPMYKATDSAGSEYVNMSRGKQQGEEAAARERMRRKFGGSGGIRGAAVGSDSVGGSAPARATPKETNEWAADGWDAEWGDDDDDVKPIAATGKAPKADLQPQTSEYDPFGLEDDFLGEIDAVLNGDSDDLDNGSGPVHAPPAPAVPAPAVAPQSKAMPPAPPAQAAPKPDTVAGDDFFSSFGV